MYFDGAAQNSGLEAMGQPKDPANVEEIPAEVNQRKERNRVAQFKHRKAKNQKRNDNLSKPSDSIVLEPLRLIMGKDNDQVQITIRHKAKVLLGHIEQF